jgi:hypothetical protein
MDLPSPHGPTLLDIFMIHPLCLTYVAAVSQTRDAAAALPDDKLFCCRETRDKFYPLFYDKG